MMSAPAPWARLVIPPDTGMVSLAQQFASAFAARLGFDQRRRDSIELVVEELLALVLHYSFDDGKASDGELSLECRLESPCLRIQVIDLGLPFDLSMVPEYRADTLDAMENTVAGLSVCLLKHKTDQFRMLNHGQEGLRLEVTWFLPAEHIEAMDPPATRTDEGPSSLLQDAVPQRLDERFAMQIARLVFRSYGYSYVYADIYYPERVIAYLRTGLLYSWGVVAASGELVGHLALMKESAGARALEWGVAVVAPAWRGRGLMERMLRAVMDYAAARTEPVLFAHAVTAHIYTQKTCHRFGFLPYALLLGYAPASLQFKGLNDHPVQRESTFLMLRAMQPMPRATLYLPPRYAPVLRVLLAQLEPPLPASCLHAGDLQAPWSQSVTVYEVSTAHCINIGRINIAVAGDDCAPLLWNETRRLAREGIDVIYLTIDLADPGAARFVEIARQVGYSLAGLCPMMPFNYGLCLQFLCSCEVDMAGVQCDGEGTAWLRDQVRDDAQ